MAEIRAPQLELSFAEASALNRMAIEQAKLRQFFPHVAFVRTGSNVIAAVGTIDTHSSNTYAVRVQLDRFPYSLPKVIIVDYVIHPEVPHRYNDGSLCIMRGDQWRSHFTVALVLAKTAIWLGKYEIWKRNGHHWPGRGQSH
jgi:ubiquitin-protein ligase